jgi:hypothetical protein
MFHAVRAESLIEKIDGCSMADEISGALVKGACSFYIQSVMKEFVKDHLAKGDLVESEKV